MKTGAFALGLLPVAARALNVLQSNDDGWAEANLRTFYYSLTDAGFSSVISAPAENKSGTGSRDGEPEEVDDGCQFDSCPAGSPPIGRNASEPRFNYVNSFPVTSMKYGISDLSPEFFDGPPDVAVAGPNTGSNLGIVTQFSGTVGAATEAAKQGIPAIAFSGASGTQVAWNSPPQPYQSVYADLATTVVQALTGTDEPFLPEGIWLNVNFPEVKEDSCSSPADFKFVLSRIYPALPLITGDDVETCDNGGRLPVERSVEWTDGCFAPISVGTADSKSDADAEAQAAVLEKLSSILSCLP